MCRNFHCFIDLHTAPLACTVPTTIDDLSQHTSGALWEIWYLFSEIKYIKRAASVSQLPLQRNIALPLIEHILHFTILQFPFSLRYACSNAVLQTVFVGINMFAVLIYVAAVCMCRDSLWMSKFL